MLIPDVIFAQTFSYLHVLCISSLNILDILSSAHIVCILFCISGIDLLCFVCRHHRCGTILTFFVLLYKIKLCNDYKELNLKVVLMQTWRSLYCGNPLEIRGLHKVPLYGIVSCKIKHIFKKYPKELKTKYKSCWSKLMYVTWCNLIAGRRFASSLGFISS